MAHFQKLLKDLEYLSDDGRIKVVNLLLNRMDPDDLLPVLRVVTNRLRLTKTDFSSPMYNAVDFNPDLVVYRMKDLTPFQDPTHLEALHQYMKQRLCTSELLYIQHEGTLDTKLHRPLGSDSGTLFHSHPEAGQAAAVLQPIVGTGNMVAIKHGTIELANRTTSDIFDILRGMITLPGYGDLWQAGSMHTGIVTINHELRTVVVVNVEDP